MIFLFKLLNRDKPITLSIIDNKINILSKNDKRCVHNLILFSKGTITKRLAQGCGVLCHNNFYSFFTFISFPHEKVVRIVWAI